MPKKPIVGLLVWVFNGRSWSLIKISIAHDRALFSLGATIMNHSEFQIVSKGPMLLGECPLWHPLEQCLYWIDIANCLVYCLELAAGEERKWSLPSEPGCIALRESGGLIVAMRNGLFTLDTQTGQLNQMLAAPYDQHKYRFNDGRCDAAGRLWTGTLVDARNDNSGKLYCLEHGRLTEHNSPVMVSNGVAFSPDSKTLYHADTSAHQIKSFQYDMSSGTPSNPHVFKTFTSTRDTHYGGRPDGAAVDSEGAYWVAMYEGACIRRFASDGQLLQSISVPFMCPTMIAFGGLDLKTLFITSAKQKRSSEELARMPYSGFVISIRVEIAGLAEYFYRD